MKHEMEEKFCDGTDGPTYDMPGALQLPSTDNVRLIMTT